MFAMGRRAVVCSWYPAPARYWLEEPTYPNLNACDSQVRLANTMLDMRSSNGHSWLQYGHRILVM
jgi:hypothetical protein